MHIKEFFRLINHRFRNARPIEDTKVQADLINAADDVVGAIVYEIENKQEILGIECFAGSISYGWGEIQSDKNIQEKSFAEILSIVRGLMESTSHSTIIEDSEAEDLTKKLTKSNEQLVVAASSVNSSGKYTVSINVTFSDVVDSATMDAALAEFRDRLKLPNSVQYKITSESVTINHK